VIFYRLKKVFSFARATSAMLSLSFFSRVAAFVAGTWTTESSLRFFNMSDTTLYFDCQHCGEPVPWWEVYCSPCEILLERPPVVGSDLPTTSLGRARAAISRTVGIPYSLRIILNVDTGARVVNEVVIVPWREAFMIPAIRTIEALQQGRPLPYGFVSRDDSD